MAKPVGRLKTNEFSGFWRVNGFNNISTTGKSAPRIFVSMTQIKEENMADSLYANSSLSNQKWINQPLSRISDLLIGSCWHGGIEGGGRRVNRLAPLKKKFIVDTSHIQIVRLNQPTKLNGVLYDTVLPYSAINFKDHRKLLEKTLYAVVPVLNDPDTEYLVVSCYELYRAYYGVSSRYLNNIAVTNMSRYMQWQNPALKVNTKLSRLEQFVAYRGFCTEEGRHSFNMPRNYLSKLALYNMSSSIKEPLVIMATFPFKGRTTLTVAGKPFCNEKAGNKVWCMFAANLLQCSRPVDFMPIIETDRSSNTPLPWQEDTVNTPPIDDPFEEEDLLDSNELPNAKGKSAAWLESNNFFEAMKDLTIKHVRSNEENNPVYEDELGLVPDGSSYDELSYSEGGENLVQQQSDFDSYVDDVNRELSDFIKMISVFRQLVAKRGWTVTTRSYGPIIMIENEIVTTFLFDQNPRRKWHRVEKGSDSRLRQIVWTEIAINREQFIYLVEMELTDKESGRSTLCIVGDNFNYMTDSDFIIFLRMTAIQNKWPRESHMWKTEKAIATAEEYFLKFKHFGIRHHCQNAKVQKSKNEISIDWASIIESNLVDRFIVN